jgi:hypothetical protein
MGVSPGKYEDLLLHVRSSQFICGGNIEPQLNSPSQCKWSESEAAPVTGRGSPLGCGTSRLEDVLARQPYAPPAL